MTEHKETAMSRRRFLAATASTVALTAVPTIILPKRAEAYQPGGRIHPNVNPLRVVGVTDPGMTAAVKENASWAEQEELVVSDVIQENMDRMAVALAEESSPADAWKKILLKPPAKSWNDVVIGIKSNQAHLQHPQSVVLGKVCRVLTDLLGAKGSNIHVYDACKGHDMATLTPFKGLPEGVHLAGTWGGYNTDTTVARPYFDGQRHSRCIAPLVRNEADILIDMAMCKGHNREFGGFTMCMKNYFGTFDPAPAHKDGGGADYLIGINKSPEILGRIDARTGDVLFPRQQLCIVDALWASKRGPRLPPNAQPNALLMGVFGPAVDYVCAMRLRKDVLGWPVQEQVAGRFLTEFGYSESDLPNGGQIINAAATRA